MTPERIRQLRGANRHRSLTMGEVDELLDDIELKRGEWTAPTFGYDPRVGYQLRLLEAS